METVMYKTKYERADFSGTYQTEISRTILRSIFIGLVLRYDVDIIDDPVIVKTRESLDGVIPSVIGYRVMVPIVNGAIFAYFQDNSQKYYVQIITDTPIDDCDIDVYFRRVLKGDLSLERKYHA